MAVALVAFFVSISMDVFILLPKRGLVFAQKGLGLYQRFFAVRADIPEVYWGLTYQLDRFLGSKRREDPTVDSGFLGRGTRPRYRDIRPGPPLRRYPIFIMTNASKPKSRERKALPPPPPPMPDIGRPETELSFWGFREWRARRKKKSR
jgi:hypothetical protein